MSLTPMVKQADALTSACSAGATNLELAAAALASVWEVMASPAKVSVLAVCCFLFLYYYNENISSGNFFLNIKHLRLILSILMSIVFCLLLKSGTFQACSSSNCFRVDHKSRVEIKCGMPWFFFIFFQFSSIAK